MNVVVSPQPHFYPYHDSTRRSPTRSMAHSNNTMMNNNRKRKAEDDFDEMLVSPLNSPAMQIRQLAVRPSKKIRSTDTTGRPLSLPRLLETLDAASLRNILQQICDRQPDMGEAVVKYAPKPTVTCALDVLHQYEGRLRAAFPYGHANSSSDYTYYRVKAQLVALLDALADFTPQYLPPVETQANVSLQYLDGATKTVHDLPEWESRSYRHHKENAYDEISRAWATVITEASKRGGGFILHTGSWDQKLAKHNEQSGGRLGTAMSAMAENVVWVGGGPNASPEQQPNTVLNGLIAGTYGSPVRCGPW